MHGVERDSEATPRRAHGIDEGPWAVALNQSAATTEIEVTLLAFAVVDGAISVSGIIRVVRRPDVRLLNIPVLTLTTFDGPPLAMTGAHVVPSGRIVWVSWVFERPADVSTEYVGRIDHVDLAYRAGGIVRAALPGPWDFNFTVPDATEPGRSTDRGESDTDA